MPTETIRLAQRTLAHGRPHFVYIAEMLDGRLYVGMTDDLNRRICEHSTKHPDLFWNQFPNIPPDLARRLPHTFSLLMRKE
jgi:hypothetical protein